MVKIPKKPWHRKIKQLWAHLQPQLSIRGKRTGPCTGIQIDRCNFETEWLSTCPSGLLGVCKTEDEIKRMQIWELVSDKFEYENWDTDKCPVVK